MKRHLLILSLLLLTATSASAQTAYAIWCAGNKTLYFDYTTSSITAGSTYEGQTVTNVWSGDDVLNTNFFYYGGKWGVTCCVWYDAAHTTAERVVIKDAFSGAPVKKTRGWFYEFGNLTAVEGLGNISGDYLEDTHRMFYGCKQLTSLDLSGFQTPNVTDMSYMFHTCSALTSLDLSGFDTSNVWNMSYMFLACSSLQELDLSNFDTSNVTNMYCMFSSCNSLKELDLSNFNTSKVTDMSTMFMNCSSLTKVNLSSFDTSKVTDLHYMFYGCSSLTWLDLYNFNTEQVTNFSYMFQKCTSLKRLDITNFTAPKSKSFADMFSQCGRLLTIYCDNSWTSVNGNPNEGMFLGCEYLYGVVGYLSIRDNLDYANPNTGYFTHNTLYPLWIAGNQVRESNKNNLIDYMDGIKRGEGNALAYFETSSNKLYLENVRVEGGELPAIRSEVDGLLLQAMGQVDVYLTSTSAPALQLDGNTTISGSSFLHVEGGSAGIRTTAGVEISGQKMSVSGEYGIIGIYVSNGYKFDNEFYDICKGSLSVTGKSDIEVNSAYACVRNFGEIRLGENVKVVSPFNAQVREFEMRRQPLYGYLKCVDISVPDPNYVDTGEAIIDEYLMHPGWNVVTGTVVISYVDPELAEKYDLSINGTQVTSLNKDDLTKINGVTASEGGYARFDPETNTLTLCGVEVSDLYIANMTSELTIQTEGDQPVKVVEELCLKSARITGTAPMEVSGGIVVVERLVLDGIDLTVTGTQFGIRGNYSYSYDMFGDMVVTWSGILEIQGKSRLEVQCSSICVGPLAEIKLGENIRVTEPKGAEVRTFLSDYQSSLSESTYQDVSLRNSDDLNDPNAGDSKHWGYDRVTGTVVIAYSSEPMPTVKRGDVNKDGKVDISDIVAVINTIAGDPTYKETAKVNDDDKVDISDIVAIINIIASGDGGSQTETDAAVKAGLCPDTNHPHAIDLGDGVKWSCCNVGASAPWEYGGYYAWGETEEKSAYDWNTYTHSEGSEETCRDLGSDIAGTQYDVAHVKWGNGWHMPSRDEIDLLCNKCTTTQTSLNGVNGRKVTGSNGASVFLPSADFKSWLGSADFVGKNGYYWSSTQNPDDSSAAYSLYFRSDSFLSGSILRGNCLRICGQSVRPVKQTDAAVKEGLCPDTNHPHVIDLGIGVKFACCNVGASAPWENGGYYAWGETEEKDYYDWSTYSHCDGTQETCHDLGSDIAGTQYDVAHVKWGGGWHMPSNEQLRLLDSQCSSVWTSLIVNGYSYKGYKITGPNGASIFLPATGYRIGGKTEYFNSDGDRIGGYWSSTQYPSSLTIAYLLIFRDGNFYWFDYNYRNTSESVRPVK